MKPAVVKSRDQYAQYLARIEELVPIDPAPDSSLGQELELLSLLVEEYEGRTFVLRSLIQSKQSSFA